MSKETARTFRQLVRGLKPGDLREVGRYSQQETLYVQMYARSAEIYELTIEDGDVVADPLVRFEIVQGRVRPVVRFGGCIADRQVLVMSCVTPTGRVLARAIRPLLTAPILHRFHITRKITSLSSSLTMTVSLSRLWRRHPAQPIRPLYGR